MTTLSSFWCSESLLVTVSGPQGRSIVAVEKPFARIGSHSRSEVVLKGVDARCLYLHATPDGIFCVQLAPTQGRAPGFGSWLKPQELLQVGLYEISVRLQGERVPAPPRVALTAWGSATPPLPVCEIFSGGKIRDKRRFRARLNLVGRRRELALQMQGQQVSSFHCALFWDSGRLWCIDLLSSNGTLLQDQPIDCSVLEMGQTLEIGEFSLLLKRLSQATARASAWKTSESDEEMLANGQAPAETEPPPGFLAQTISTHSGDTGKAQPDAASSPLESAPSTAELPARHLLLRAHAELREDQQLLQNEFAQRTEQLLAQRQQLDQQWHQTSQEVASQVSHLQQESALLAAQKQEVAKLRSEWEEQRRVLTTDLQNMKLELTQHQTLLDKQKHYLAHSGEAAFDSEVVDHEEVNHQGLPAPTHSRSESPLAMTQAHRSLHDDVPAARTVIEGSYVVEKEISPADSASRADFSPVPFPSPGRRRASELIRESPPPQLPDSPVSTDKQALTVIESGLTSNVPHDEAAPKRATGRRKQTGEDRMGEFVTDRLVQREQTGRFWLRVLWIAAGAALLLGLAILGYILQATR